LDGWGRRDGRRRARVHVSTHFLSRGQRRRLSDAGKPVMALQSEFPNAISTRRVRAVALGRIVVFGGAFLLMVAILRHHDAGFGFSLRVAAVAASTALVSSLAQLWFARRRRFLRELAMAQLLLDQVLISALVYLSGGVA